MGTEPVSVMDEAGACNRYGCADPPLIQCPSHRIFAPPLQWEARPGGQLHDTLKPLAANRLDLRSTLLIDNEAHKGASGEEANMIALPTWEHCTGGGPWGVQDHWGGAVCIVLPRSLRHPILPSLG